MYDHIRAQDETRQYTNDYINDNGVNSKTEVPKMLIHVGVVPYAEATSTFMCKFISSIQLIIIN